MTLTMALATVTATAVQPPEPGVVQVSATAAHRFYTNPGDPDGPADYAAFPAAINLSTTSATGAVSRRIVVDYGQLADPGGGSAGGGKALRQTTDEVNWSALPAPNGYVGVSGAVRLADAAGTMLAIDFDSECNASGNASGCLWNGWRRWLLNGNVWTNGGRASVSYQSPSPAWARFHKAPIVLSDSKTLVATYYGGTGTTTDYNQFVGVIKSTDDGRTWTEVKRLVQEHNVKVSEATIAETSDGRLQVLYRRDKPENYRVSELWMAMSSNASATGGTWSTPLQLGNYYGNSPTLTMLGNGVLTAGIGRPDNNLWFILNGKAGNGFSDLTTVYSNRPTTGTFDFANGSSGTVGLAPLDGHRVMAIGDNCAAQWGCPSTAGGYTVDNAQALWSSVVEVNTSQWGRLDLLSGFRRGEVKFVGSPTFVSYGRGRTSLGAYAFDGDARNDSSAVTSNRSVTLDLGRVHDVTGFGLTVRLQGSSDVRIETSMDGTTWTTPGRGTRSGILRPLSTPTAARYVRITDPNAVVDGTAAFLNELEVYTMTQGFENNLVGKAPAGAGLVSADPRAVVVNASDVPFADAISSRFLRLTDYETNALTRIAWAHGTSGSADLSFRTRAYGADSHAMLFDVMGRNSAGEEVVAYHLMLRADNGQLYRWTASGGWGSPIGSAAVEPNSWNLIRVQASTTSATISANGTAVGTTTPSTPVTSLTGNAFSTSGSVPVGDYWLFDDVTYLRP